MDTQRQAHGRFGKNNRFGRGRPAGSRNREKQFQFAKDGRSGISMQRFQTVYSRIANDLGGRENLTEAQLQIVRRCAMLSAQCELMESQAVEGQPLNAVTYGTLTGHLVRALNALGLKREPVDVTPALHQYLETLPAETQDAVAAAGADEGEG